MQVINLLGYTFEITSSTHRVNLPLLAITLAELLEEPISSGDLDHAFCSISRQALQGLEYLHATGIAHRDINPRNIMFDEDGTLKYIDFSTAFAPGIHPTEEDQGQMICQVGTGWARPYKVPRQKLTKQAVSCAGASVWRRTIRRNSSRSLGTRRRPGGVFAGYQANRRLGGSR
jgi:serine/threonine protein kinase